MLCRGRVYSFSLQVNKAGKEGKRREQKEAAVKEFEVMVKYCESVSCRHALFSKYFGDSPPQCRDRCDACKDKKGAMARLDTYMRGGEKGPRGFRTTGVKEGNDHLSMYGEGRKGQKREADDYGGDSDEGDGGKSREKAAKMQREGQIRKQFKLRKKGGGEEEKAKATKLGHARVKAAEFTEVKISGLDLKTREDYLGLTQTSLTRNYKNLETFKTKDCSTEDILGAAIEAEYEVFTSNKVITMYRKRMAQLISSIKKDTDSLEFSKLLSAYSPPPPPPKNDLASLARAVKEERSSQSSSAFHTVKEEINDEQSTSQSSSGLLEKKKKGFRMKREKNTQQTMERFMKASVKQEDVDESRGSNPFSETDEEVDPDAGDLTTAMEVKEELPESPDAEGDLLPCPLCFASFPLEMLERHAAGCQEQVEDEEQEDKEEQVEQVPIKAEKGIGRPNPPTSHAMSSSEDDEEEPSAFLSTRKRWQQRDEQGGSDGQGGEEQGSTGMDSEQTQEEPIANGSESKRLGNGEKLKATRMRWQQRAEGQGGSGGQAGERHGSTGMDSELTEELMANDRESKQLGNGEKLRATSVSKSEVSSKEGTPTKTVTPCKLDMEGKSSWRSENGLVRAATEAGCEDDGKVPLTEEASKLQKLLDKMKKDIEESDARKKEDEARKEEQKRIDDRARLQAKIMEKKKRMPKDDGRLKESKLGSLNGSMSSSSNGSSSKLKEGKREEVGKSRSKEDGRMDVHKSRTDSREKESRNDRKEVRPSDPHAASRQKLLDKLQQKKRASKVGNTPGKVVSKQPSTPNGVSGEKKRKVADEFVRCLAPFLKSGSIACKTSFKVLARELTHAAVRTAVSTEGVRDIVARFFKQQDGPVVEDKAKQLVMAFKML